MELFGVYVERGFFCCATDIGRLLVLLHGCGLRRKLVRGRGSRRVHNRLWLLNNWTAYVLAHPTLGQLLRHAALRWRSSSSRIYFMVLAHRKLALNIIILWSCGSGVCHHCRLCHRHILWHRLNAIARVVWHLLVMLRRVVRRVLTVWVSLGHEW